MKINYIHFPLYMGGKYECLEDIIREFKNHPWQNLRTYICKIVEYNIRYRDILRDNGIEELIEHLCAETPSFKDEMEAIKELREWYSKVGKLADYDIQCYGSEDAFEVLGQTFLELQEIRRRTEMFARESLGEPLYIFAVEPVESPDGLHIGKLFKSFPKFDADDDDRSYGNYVIRNCRITESDMESISKVPAYGHDEASRMHEMIPADQLPIIYYEEYNDYMILASAKKRANKTNKSIQ